MAAENAAWPGDEATLVRWIRASLQPEEAGMVRGLDDVRITADVSGANVERLLIDATGVEMRLLPDAHAAAALPPSTTPPEVLQRRAGLMRSARIVAQPIRIDRTPLHLDLELHDVPVEWIVYDAPATPGRPETTRNIDLPVLAGAGIRWRLLTASARGTARIGVSDDGVITVRDLAIGSRNPIVAIALRAARRSVQEQIGQTYDLNEGFSAEGPRLRDVRVAAGDEITVTARFS